MSSENLMLYNKIRSVPEEAQKTITGGRLKGMTDINPMWRIKTLTEQFGPCGIGWKYVIKKEWIEEGANGEKVAFMDIDLLYKYNGEWSEPVPGTGGSSFVTNESKGLYTSDEVYKMALTDAISVSCKAIGMGADIYYAKDRTKYDASKKDIHTAPSKAESKTTSTSNPTPLASKEQIVELFKKGASIKKEKESFDIFSFLDTLANNGTISTKYPYKDKEKTIINWTVDEYNAIMQALIDESELPF